MKAELQVIHDGVLALMDKDLIPLANTRESKELYLKMKGDSGRHLAEFGTGDTESKAAFAARRMYPRKSSRK